MKFILLCNCAGTEGLASRSATMNCDFIVALSVKSSKPSSTKPSLTSRPYKLVGGTPAATSVRAVLPQTTAEIDERSLVGEQALEHGAVGRVLEMCIFTKVNRPRHG